MLTKAEMKTRMMLNTPTRVLLVRDWTIFFETVCMAAGKSFKRGAESNELRTIQVQVLMQLPRTFTLMQEYMAQMKRMLARMTKILM